MENLSKDKPVRPRGLHKAVVIGVSAGGLEVLTMLLPLIPAGFPLPVIVVQHLHPLQDRSFFGNPGPILCTCGPGSRGKGKGTPRRRLLRAP